MWPADKTLAPPFSNETPVFSRHPSHAIRPWGFPATSLPSGTGDPPGTGPLLRRDRPPDRPSVPRPGGGYGVKKRSGGYPLPPGGRQPGADRPGMAPSTGTSRRRGGAFLRRGPGGYAPLRVGLRPGIVGSNRLYPQGGARGGPKAPPLPPPVLGDGITFPPPFITKRSGTVRGNARRSRNTGEGPSPGRATSPSARSPCQRHSRYRHPDRCSHCAAHWDRPFRSP